MTRDLLPNEIDVLVAMVRRFDGAHHGPIDIAGLDLLLTRSRFYANWWVRGSSWVAVRGLGAHAVATVTYSDEEAFTADLVTIKLAL
jgi:hypothetical protein